MIDSVLSKKESKKLKKKKRTNEVFFYSKEMKGYIQKRVEIRKDKIKTKKTSIKYELELKKIEHLIKINIYLIKDLFK